METTLGGIVELTGGKLLRGEAQTVLSGFAALDAAEADQVSFYGNERYASQLEDTKAGAVLVASTEVQAPDQTALILVENPVVAFDAIIRKYGVRPPQFSAGISDAAFVAETAEVDPEAVSVLANASILAGVKIGRGTRIGAGTVISENAEIGEDCEIGPNVTVREGCIIGDRAIIHPGVVIGGDGFGFEFSEGRHQKIEQLGIVRIEDDVEIGSNTTIDRARFGETVIGEGTKIDNLVQIGHNAIIGKHCIIVAQTGISGSTTIGNYVVFGAQSGVAGHLNIADQNTLAGRSGVISSIEEPGGTWFGYPAKHLKESRRESMQLKKLPGLIKKVKELEKTMNQQG